MAHRVYLDADSCDTRLVAALERAGFDVALGTVEVPDGASDDTQLRRASELRRTMVTGNAVDFMRLHTAFANAGTAHHGIVTYRRADHRSAEALANAIVELLSPLPPETLEHSVHRI